MEKSLIYLYQSLIAWLVNFSCRMVPLGVLVFQDFSSVSSLMQVHSFLSFSICRFC
ncbi:hypothetical protein HanPI659440_Chr13g0496821 [Helianthus annuus]|nr:hypothetical protein HanPI659440_Chr13g0496821 [Helianthus annuus]